MALFSSIAAGVGAATGLAAGTSSLIQAGKQRKAAQVGAAASEKLMREAKKEIEKSEYEKLNIPKDAYQAESIANAGIVNQGIQSLQEAGGRTLAAGIGKIVGQGTAAEEANRIQMGQALYENDVMKADARQNQNNEMAALAVGGAQDQQLMARDMQEAAAANTTSAFSAFGGAMESAAAAVPLYTKSKTDRRVGQMMGSEQFGAIDFSATGANKVGMTRLDASGKVIPLMEQNPLFVQGATAGQKGFGEKQYTNNQQYRAMNEIEKRKVLTDNFKTMYPKGRDYRKARKGGFGTIDFQKYYN